MHYLVSRILGTNKECIGLFEASNASSSRLPSSTWYLETNFQSRTTRRLYTVPLHLPCQAVCLAALVPQVAHFAVFDVHPCLSHVAFSSAIAILVVVGDDLRNGADVRSAIVFVIINFVVACIPGEHLSKSRGGGVGVDKQCQRYNKLGTTHTRLFITGPVCASSTVVCFVRRHLTGKIRALTSGSRHANSALSDRCVQRSATTPLGHWSCDDVHPWMG